MSTSATHSFHLIAHYVFMADAPPCENDKVSNEHAWQPEAQKPSGPPMGVTHWYAARHDAVKGLLVQRRFAFLSFLDSFLPVVNTHFDEAARVSNYRYVRMIKPVGQVVGIRVRPISHRPKQCCQEDGHSQKDNPTQFVSIGIYAHDQTLPRHRRRRPLQKVASFPPQHQLQPGAIGIGPRHPLAEQIEVR